LTPRNNNCQVVGDAQRERFQAFRLGRPANRDYGSHPPSAISASRFRMRRSWCRALRVGCR
jgi:hypothetical protein